MSDTSPFATPFLGGFECSTHRRADGTRLDLLAATEHDRLAEADYRQLAEHGMRTVRDGIRWHRIETRPGHYDWSSFLPMLKAASRTGTEVIWDLCHYGWPDDIDIWSEDFVDRFRHFAAAVAQMVRTEAPGPRFYCPVNEISFWAWAGGEVGHINPLATRAGHPLKRQLARAAIAAVDAVRATDPEARFVTAEPLIHVESGSPAPDSVAEAERYRISQFEAVDLLCGRQQPDLGGHAGCLDIVGVNFYPHNQWYLGGSTIPMGHHAYRPLADMLAEVHARYGRPILIAETGAEGSARASWLHYVCGEVKEARERGVPVAGICLYPVLDYPGWDNGRMCRVGLLGQAGPDGTRPVCERTARELRRQTEALRLPSAAAA